MRIRSQLVLAKDAAVTAVNSIMAEHIKMDELKDAEGTICK